MTVPRFLVGVLLMAVALGPVGAGAAAVRARVLGWVGVPARVVEVVVACTTVVVTSELLGVIGLYRVAPIVVGLALVGMLELWWGRRRPVPASGQADRHPTPPRAGEVVDDGPGEPVPATQMGRWGSVLVVVALSVLLADWAPRVIDAYHHGMTTVDTVWYHLPMVTRFVQTGRIGPIQYFDNDSITAFYPGNSELFHGLGILTLGSDLLSPLIDLLWLGFALVCAWSIGRRYRLAPLTVTGVAVVFATPGLVGTQPGGAYNDVVTIALLLASLAILIEAHRREAPSLAAYGLAAAAAGLALGTKFTMLIPVAALTVGVLVIAPRGQRLRRAEAWVSGLFVTGSFWYYRNIFTAGNPLPSLGLNLGPVHLRDLSNETKTVSSVSHYLFSGSAWRTYLVPGLDKSLGWGWWLLLAVVAAGTVAGLVIGPTWAHRLLAWVAGATVVGYLFTQQILGPPGHPVYFGVNVRYIAPGLVLGLVALPSAAVRWPRLRAPIFGLYLVMLAVLQLDPTLWPSHLLRLSFVPAIRGTDSAIGVLIALLVLVVGLAIVVTRTGLDPVRSRPWAAAGAIAVVLVIGGAVLTPYYQRHRYQKDPFYTWATDLHDQRIGVYGAFAFLQYPAAGRGLSNHVQFLGLRGPDGTFGPIPDCPTWRRIINAGHYDDIFVTGEATFAPAEWRWTSTDSNVTQGHVPAGDLGRRFLIHGPLDPATCP